MLQVAGSSLFQLQSPLSQDHTKRFGWWVNQMFTLSFMYVFLQFDQTSCEEQVSKCVSSPVRPYYDNLMTRIHCRTLYSLSKVELEPVSYVSFHLRSLLGFAPKVPHDVRPLPYAYGSKVRAPKSWRENMRELEKLPEVWEHHKVNISS